MVLEKKYAIFYRLDDKDNIVDLYHDHLETISYNFTKYVKNTLKKQPDTSEVNQFFQKAKVSLTLPQDADKEKVIDYLISADKSLLETDDLLAISNWFEVKKNDVKKIAEEKFYQTPSTVAKGVGTIYDPDEHNWGVNVAWALAVTKKQLPVKFLSELDVKNKERGSPTEISPGVLRYTENPSAFALEIAIAKNMGYKFSFKSDGSIGLTPPTVPGNHLTTGVAGNGFIPTKLDQLKIFDLAIKAKALYDFSQNNPQQFRDEVHNVCAGVDIDAKKELMDTL